MPAKLLGMEPHFLFIQLSRVYPIDFQLAYSRSSSHPSYIALIQATVITCSSFFFSFSFLASRVEFIIIKQPCICGQTDIEITYITYISLEYTV